MIRRFVCALALLGLAACTPAPQEPAFDFGEPTMKHEMRGEVLRLRPENRIAVIKHEDIDDWMKAMTMDFPVPDAAEYAKLKEGMTIRATVQRNDAHYWLTGIQPEP
jgi:Cu/Ag efflux protein CusF